MFSDSRSIKTKLSTSLNARIPLRSSIENLHNYNKRMKFKKMIDNLKSNVKLIKPHNSEGIMKINLGTTEIPNNEHDYHNDKPYELKFGKLKMTKSYDMIRSNSKV